MDETLLKAIDHLLGHIDEIVDDLLLVEVDWGEDTPGVTDETVEVNFQGGRWPLVFSDSELVVRSMLCHSAGRRAIVVFPSEDGFKVPLDVQARAHKKTSLRLGLRHRLYALTERDWPPEVDYAEWRPSIERHIDELVRGAGSAGLRWAVTRSDLEEILVQTTFGLAVAERDASELLADLVSLQRRSPDPPAELELSLLQGQLRLHQIAWPEVIIWAAAKPGRAEELVRSGTMMGAEQAANLLPNWGRLANLRALLVRERQTPESDAISVVIELATAALSYLHPSTRRSIAKAAEADLGAVLPAESYNMWFPGTLVREIERIANRLASRDPDAASRVPDLHAHLFASQQGPQLTVLDEMAKLVTKSEEQHTLIEDVTTVPEWGAWYTNHGSRIDLSALKLMYLRHGGTGLDESIRHLLDGYWRWRDELNAVFAGCYIDAYESALHDRGSGTFGIHRILDWVVRPLLRDRQRVLLLVVDGMGLPACWHLLDQWSRHGESVYVRDPQVALSLLPSVTSMSRKGLFLSALPTDRLDDEQTYDTKARTSELTALRETLKDSEVRLYNKTNLGSGQGLLNDLQSAGVDLVAVILNEIDDDLRSTTTTVRLPRLEELGLLLSTVRRALDAGWSVLMTADHGHTWHRDKDLRRGEIGPGGGERFMAISGEERLPADAIVTQDPNIVRVQEGEALALLTATGTYFGRIPRRGYHGGASLEEVLVPCAVLTYEAPAAVTKNKTGVESTEQLPTESYDLTKIVLTLRDGRTIRLGLPFAASPMEARLLQTLARLGEASEAQLKQALASRRIAGPLSSLRDRLAAAGPEYDYVEDRGAGPEGTIYRFRTEMLR